MSSALRRNHAVRLGSKQGRHCRDCEASDSKVDREPGASRHSRVGQRRGYQLSYERDGAEVEKRGRSAETTSASFSFN